MSDLRDYVERVYAKGDDWADYAKQVIELLDSEEEYRPFDDLIGNLAFRMDIPEPKDASDIDRFEEDIMCINNDYRAIVRTLTDLGVVSDPETADIPAMLRLLIAAP